MEKTFKIGETALTVKGLKADIERIIREIKMLTGIRSHVVEKSGIIGGEEREISLYVVLGQHELRDTEGYETEKAEFVKWLSSKVITVADYPYIKTKVKEIFDAHVHIEDYRLTPEQRQQKTIERNESLKIIEAKIEQKRIETDREKEQLKKDYPYLKLVADSGLSPRIIATKNIRIELNRAFPGLNFSIRSEIFSGGNSINIEWTDGATNDEVNKITKKYQEGYFDGMNDIYEYSNKAFCNLFGGAKYVLTNRAVSNEKMIEVGTTMGFDVSFKDWKMIVKDKNGEIKTEFQQMVSREAYNTSFYIKPEITSKDQVSMDGSLNSQGITVKENKEHQGIEIVFDSKPDQSTIDRLKANRFRWNNRTKVWYSKLNSNSLSFANSFIKVPTGEVLNS